MQSHIQELRASLRGRIVPETWLADGLHPVDHADGQWFLDHVAGGERPEDLFGSAITYFAFLSDDARLFYLAEMLVAAAADPFTLTYFLVDLRSARGVALRSRLSPTERQYFAQIADAIEEGGVMQIAAEEVRELRRFIA